MSEMKNKKAMMMAAGAVALGMTSAPSQAQNSSDNEIRVGIIDVRADAITFTDSNTQIEYRTYNEEGRSPASLTTASGHDHGRMVASAFVEQARKLDQNAPIRIYAANPFESPESEGQKNTLSINWEGATEALEWFKKNDVKVVLTAFSGNDSEEMKNFIRETERHGMTVFASAGNKDNGPSYPAQYMGTIAVAADNEGLPFRKDPAISTWVDFAMKGDAPGNSTSAEANSAYASAKAAAIGAHYARYNPSADNRQILNALHEISVETTYTAGKEDFLGWRLEENGTGPKVAEIAKNHVKEAQLEAGSESTFSQSHAQAYAAQSAGW